MVKVTEEAKNKIISLLQEENTTLAETYVRVGVTSGGCSGLSYNLSFDKELKEDDKVFEDNGVRIAVDKKSFLYLVGMTLEYSGGLNGKGFVFNNPNASRTCGCGESFAV
ncbi:HesB/IscA family protein [Vaginella massiliensis]|uniref:HesB/IscA family protein n=1 Tax=Vaginella massiliensis TaxID=1816680 RepID=UPI0008385516|nr:iron-sulfur cluster assembly accessory protein [Vaginella massiliensis]